MYVNMKSLIVTIVATLLLPGMMMLDTASASDIPMGALDAHISGKVLNASAGFTVQMSTFDASSPPNLIWHNFTGITDPQGRFDVTVDSDPAKLLPYTVSIRETYYKVPVRMQYSFLMPINASETQAVPDGELELVDAPLGDLAVTILNGSSMQPLQGVNVDIDAASVPDPPFPTAKMTDAQGTVIYLGIRSVNTTVKATRANFLSLSQSTDQDFVEVASSVRTNATFVIKEKPWPFTTDPADGASDVNHTSDILIDFKQEMDLDSIEDEGIYRLSVEGSPQESISASAYDGNTRARLTISAPLAYSSNYVLRIDTAVKTKTGAHPLWRAMVVSFTTELPPAIVSGRVLDGSSSDPITSLEVQLKSLRTRTGIDGRFEFPLVVPGEYRVTVPESYLYLGNDTDDLQVKKGDVLDIGDIRLEPRETGALEVNVFSGHRALAGAWVSIQGSELNLTTGEDGLAFFERTRTGLVTFRVGAPHHSIVLEQTQVTAGATRTMNITLIEDPAPVSVVPTMTASGGRVDISSAFEIVMPYAIEFSTLGVSLWTIDDLYQQETEIPLLPISTGQEANTYVARPVAALSRERDYVLIIDADLKAAGGSGEVLWSDLLYFFKTPDQPLSFIRGKLLFEGTPFAGLVLAFGPFSAMTDDEGAFNLSIDLFDDSMRSDLTFDGAAWGYQDVLRDIGIDAGDGIDLGTIDLMPLPGRYSVEPSDGSRGVDPMTNITFSFSSPLVVPLNGLNPLLGVFMGDDQTMVPGVITLSGGNTAVLDPAYPLVEGATYTVRVTPNLMLETGYPACPVGNETSFSTRQPKVVASLIDPPASVLDAMPLDRSLVLSFTLPVNRSVIESAISILPAPTRLVFAWRNNVELELSMFLRPSISYILDLAPERPGMNGEVMGAPFHIEFTTASNYSMDHTLRSFTIIPDPEKELQSGGNLTINGLIDDSEGYIVTIRVQGEDYDLSYTGKIGSDGSWQMVVPIPDKGGRYDLTVTIGMPDAPSAITPRTITFNVAKAEEGEDGDTSGLLTALGIFAILLVICIVVTAAVLYIFAQRKRAERELGSREYDEVDMEMEE